MNTEFNVTAVHDKFGIVVRWMNYDYIFRYAYQHARDAVTVKEELERNFGQPNGEQIDIAANFWPCHTNLVIGGPVHNGHYQCFHVQQELLR